MAEKIIHAKHTANRRNPHAAKIDKAMMLFFAAVMAWYYYGKDALRGLIFSVLAAIAADLLCAGVLKVIYHTEKLPADSFSCIFAACTVSLLLPADISAWLPCIALTVSIVFARLIYPLLTKKPTLVTADGISYELVALTLLTVLFGSRSCVFPTPHAAVGAPPPEVTDSVLQILAQKDSAAILQLGNMNLIVGNVPGPMGSTCLLLLLTFFVYLLIRRPKDAVMPASCLTAMVLMAAVFRRAGLDVGESILYELSGGMAFFLAVFVLSEKKYQPKNIILAATGGLLAGTLCMLLRDLGIFADSAAPAMLAVNLVFVFLNRTAYFKKKQKGVARKRRFVTPDDQNAYFDGIGVDDDRENAQQ